MNNNLVSFHYNGRKLRLYLEKESNSVYIFKYIFIFQSHCIQKIITKFHYNVRLRVLYIYIFNIHLSLWSMFQRRVFAFEQNWKSNSLSDIESYKVLDQLIY